MKKLVLAFLIVMLPAFVYAAAGTTEAVSHTFYVLENQPRVAHIYRFKLDTVAASTTGAIEYITLTSTKGIIDSIRVANASTDFDFSIRQKNPLDQAVDEIYRTEGVNLIYYSTDLGVYWYSARNLSKNMNLFVRVKNDDAVNATGVTWFEVTTLESP